MVDGSHRLPVGMSPDEQHRDGRLARDAVGDAAEHGPTQGAPAMGGHRHQANPMPRIASRISRRA